MNDPYGGNIWGTPPQDCADYAFQQHIMKSLAPNTDIDNRIVHFVRFDGWQNTTIGEKAVRKELRHLLWIKYQIKDEELYNKAYGYIKEYY